MKVKIPTQLMKQAVFIGKERSGEVFAFSGMPGQLPEDSAAGWGAKAIGFEFLPININSYMGGIPSGCDLVAKTPNGEMYVLYGFDEIGMFGKAQYGFSPSIGNGDLSKFEFVQDHAAFEAEMAKFVLPDGPIPVK